MPEGLVELLRLKEETARKLASLLSPEELKGRSATLMRVERPRPCGLTIHTGVGCSYGCIYCYVPDMGFPMRPRGYSLKPLQLAYSVAINPYVISTVNGTMLALGSVTEPFMKETLEDTLRYIYVLSKSLGNPMQISTKASLNMEVARRLQ